MLHSYFPEEQQGDRRGLMNKQITEINCCLSRFKRLHRRPYNRVSEADTPQARMALSDGVQ